MSNQLSIPFKKTVPIPIKSAVRSYIQAYHTDTHPDAFKRDIAVWEQLRQDGVGGTAHASKIQAALRYHAQLVFILTKLPMNIGLAIPYSIAFDPNGSMLSLPNLAYERTAVLFNLAALYSQLALSEDRSHADGIKRANANYQNAAGTLSYLIAFALPQLSTTLSASDLPPELSEAVLRSLEFLLLAQAQECAWQRAVIDHLKNGILAKLSAKTSSLYRASLESIREASASVRHAFPAEWFAHVETKQYHFQAAAQYRKSVDELEANKYGLELARLHEAYAIAKKGYDLARRNVVSKPVLDDIRSLVEIIEKNMRRAERDNDLIYHQDIPSLSTLPAIQEISLVQSATVSGLQDLKGSVGNDGVIFGELVGWGARVALEIYHDRRGNWLKDHIYDRAKALDDIASQTLQSLNLPAALDALDRPIGLPPSLLKKAEEIKLEDGPARVEASLENVDRLAERAQSILNEAMDLLDQEASEDEAIRHAHARKRVPWHRPTSYEANRDLTNKEKRYRQVLAHAAESDLHVRDKWTEWEDSIIRLTWDQVNLENWVPSSTVSPGNIVSSNSVTRRHARALRVHLEALDDVKLGRDQLVLRVRRLEDVDDIQPRIMREASGIEQWREVEPVMFEDTLDQELSKYDKFNNSVEDGASKQEQLLEQVRNVNQQFLQSRQEDQSVKDRERALQSLDLAYHKYREITRNLDEGLKFYNGLSNILVGFREACKQWVRSRRDQVTPLSDSFRDLTIDSKGSSVAGSASSSFVSPQEQLQSPVHAKPPHVLASSTSLGSKKVTLPPPSSDEWETVPAIATGPSHLSSTLTTAGASTPSRRSSDKGTAPLRGR